MIGFNSGQSFGMVRDLPVSHAFILENLLGAIPPTPPSLTRAPCKARPRPKPSLLPTFRAPSSTNSSLTPAPGGQVEAVRPKAGARCAEVFYVVPLGASRSRLITRFVADEARALPERALPAPLLHFLLNVILDQDTGTLLEEIYKRASQERRLRAEGGDWRRSYNLATSSDRFVAEFRRWYDSVADSLPNAAAGAADAAAEAPAPAEAALSDHFEQHVRGCPSCSAALRRTRAAGRALAAAALVLAALAAGSLAAAQPAAAGLAAGAAAAAGGAAAARAAESWFGYFPFAARLNKMP
eukprot:tig00020510_g9808.t1